MKSKTNLLAKGALLALLLGALSVPLVAQHTHQNMQGTQNMKGMIHVGKKGAVTLTNPLRVGDTVLKPGNYVFQHKVEGEDHFVIFQRAGDEVARLKCTLEPLEKKASRTALYTHEETGESVLNAIVVEGEKVKHLL